MNRADRYARWRRRGGPLPWLRAHADDFALTASIVSILAFPALVFGYWDLRQRLQLPDVQLLLEPGKSESTPFRLRNTTPVVAEGAVYRFVAVGRPAPQVGWQSLEIPTKDIGPLRPNSNSETVFLEEQSGAPYVAHHAVEMVGYASATCPRCELVHQYLFFRRCPEPTQGSRPNVFLVVKEMNGSEANLLDGVEHFEAGMISAGAFAEMIRKEVGQ